MKKTLTILFIFLVSFTYAQTYTRTDSVDSIAMNYLNMYRAHYKLGKVSVNKSFKDSCVAWSVRTSEPKMVNGKSKWTLKHTKSRVAEVITGGPYYAEDLSDTSRFAKFVKVVTTKKVSEMNGVEIAIMSSIFAWEKSPAHKDIITEPTYTKAYFSIYYKILKVDKKTIELGNFSIIQMR